MLSPNHVDQGINFISRMLAELRYAVIKTSLHNVFFVFTAREVKFIHWIIFWTDSWKIEIDSKLKLKLKNLWNYVTLVLSVNKNIFKMNELISKSDSILVNLALYFSLLFPSNYFLAQAIFLLIMDNQFMVFYFLWLESNFLKKLHIEIF